MEFSFKLQITPYTKSSVLDVVDKGAIMAAVQSVKDLTGSGSVAHKNQLVAVSFPERIVVRPVGAHAHGQNHGPGGDCGLFSGLGILDGDAGLSHCGELLALVKVLECEAVPKSKKLLKFTLDDGSDEKRTILSGIHAYYEPEELVGKTCIAITNLPPRAMMGIESCGMLLSAVHKEGEEEKLHLLMVDPHIPAGAKLY